MLVSHGIDRRQHAVVKAEAGSPRAGTQALSWRGPKTELFRAPAGPRAQESAVRARRNISKERARALPARMRVDPCERLRDVNAYPAGSVGVHRARPARAPSPQCSSTPPARLSRRLARRRHPLPFSRRCAERKCSESFRRLGRCRATTSKALTSAAARCAGCNRGCFRFASTTRRSCSGRRRHSAATR